MNGTLVPAPTRVRAAGRGCLAAAACALLSAIIAPAAIAQAPVSAPAAQRYAVGSPAMQVAQDLAREHWGIDPCGGQVEVVWGEDEPTINARAFWTNPVATYGAADRNGACRIVLNARLAFTWAKLCTVITHEYGHLAGHPHGADGADVMSPIYRAPLAVCAGTPDPAAPPQAAVAQPAAAPAKVSRSAGTRRTRLASPRTPRPSSSGRAARP